MELESFEISEKTGFLSKKPSQTLPGPYFGEWEGAAQRIPQLIACKDLRKEVNEKLPEIDFSDITLHTEEQWQRAYIVTTFLAQAYLWEELQGSDSLTRPVTLPKKLADPWRVTADHIGVPPVATYAALVLYNYSFRNPTMEFVSVDNLQAALSFTGNSEESWFFMVHALEESIAAEGLEAITKAYKAMSSNDTEKLEKCFKMITEILHKMEETLTKMKDGCSPDFFYNKLRPYLCFPECGIIYGESSESVVEHYRSGSGAQDSAIPAFNLFLNIEHGREEEDILKDFEVYMPAKHREFLKAIKPVRSYVLEHESGNNELKSSFDKAVGALTSFRTEHIKLVTSYIVNMKKGDVSEEDRGTGGTPFMRFLKNVRDNTNNAVIDSEMTVA